MRSSAMDLEGHRCFKGVVVSKDFVMTHMDIRILIHSLSVCSVEANLRLGIDPLIVDRPRSKVLRGRTPA